MANFNIVVFFAIVSLVAIASAFPQQPAINQRAQAPRQIVERQAKSAAAEQLEAGADDKDLAGAASYGYGYYSGYPGYSGLYGGYGYSGYPYYSGYSSYIGHSYPYYGYRGFGGLYGGYYL